MDKPKILIIEDDQGIRTQMKWSLVEDYDVFVAEDKDGAIKTIEREDPSLVVLDLGLPPAPEDTREGLGVLGRIIEINPMAKVIVVTGNPDKEAALKAISQGAYDFFTKPVNIEELKLILKRAHYVYTLEAEYRDLQNQLRLQNFEEIIGACSAMQNVFETVKKVSTTDVPVLVTGESGTGKELVARAIHNQSIRKDRPFTPINCGAIPEGLMESELFGFEKGAFTGASAQKKGRIELASNGTLFLDEIGELPVGLQVKLLRFLQDHRIERVGGGESLEIDCRVIAATNRDIEAMVSEGSFREDLYYRLAVVSIDLPPLKDRGEDIVLLARTFIQKFSDSRGPLPLSPDALEAMSSYEWPGNVRELENKVRRAIALAEGPAITSEDMGLGEADSDQDLNMQKARERLEKKLINKAMTKLDGNITKAAAELGVSRPTLHNLLKKHNIKY